MGPFKPPLSLAVAGQKGWVSGYREDSNKKNCIFIRLRKCRGNDKKEQGGGRKLGQKGAQKSSHSVKLKVEEKGKETKFCISIPSFSPFQFQRLIKISRQESEKKKNFIFADDSASE